jgi:hypothetical protein
MTYDARQTGSWRTTAGWRVRLIQEVPTSASSGLGGGPLDAFPLIGNHLCPWSPPTRPSDWPPAGIARLGSAYA